MTIRVRQNAPQTLQFTATAEGHELPLAMPQPQAGPRPARLFRYRAGRLQGADADGVRAAQGVAAGIGGRGRGARCQRGTQGVYRLTAKLTLHGELTDAQIDELLAVAEKCPIHKLMTAVDVQVSTLVVRPE